jgi:hypothetical protein
MAQADLNVANQSGAAFRSDLNGQLLALGTLQSGASAPSTTYAYMQWADTTTGLLKIRDAANAAWITVGTLASTNLGLATVASPTFTGTVTIPAGASISGYAPLASPTLTGTPAAPTASTGTNTTQLATTAYVVSQATAKAGDTMTGDLTVPSLNGGQLAGVRNRFINAGMAIDQRNAGASVSSSTGVATYTVDRWYAYATGAAVTAQRVASSNTAFTNALRVTGAASNTAVSVGQRIEAQNSYDLANKTVTLSFYAASSASITLTWKAYYAGATDNFTTQTQSNTGTQATTSTLTRYSATFTLPSAATTGVSIEIGVAGAFTSGTIDLTGVQLELGSVATPFERRSYGAELALCQRYFEVIESGGAYTNGVPFVAANRTSSERPVSHGFFRTNKRATPTMSCSTPTSIRYVSSSGIYASQTAALDYATVSAFSLSCTAGPVASFGWMDGFGAIYAAAEL